MFIRIMSLLLFFCLLVTFSSADTLSQYMYMTMTSMAVHVGEACLVVIPSVYRTGTEKYKVSCEIRERGGSDAAIKAMHIHIFDDDIQAEDKVIKSDSAKLIIKANETQKIEETIVAKLHQWICCEVVVGEKHFYGIVQCGDIVSTDQMNAQSEVDLQTKEIAQTEEEENNQ